MWGRQERDTDQRKNCKQVTSPGGEKIGVGSLRPRLSTSSSHWGRNKAGTVRQGQSQPLTQAAQVTVVTTPARAL